MTKKNYKILGLINARGGSKGIPKKNIKLIDGKPLIYYAIKAGKESKYIDRVVVSTDDREIAKVAQQYGAEIPFLRPKELAGDNVTQYPPTRHAVLELQKQGWDPDIVVLLLTNGPLKTGTDADKVIETLISSKVDSVRSACEVSTPPQWMYTLDDENILQPFLRHINIEDPNICIRQNLPKVYRATGVIDAMWTKTILEKQSLFGKRIKAVIFDKHKSIDIDTPLDLMMATIILEHMNNLK